MSRITPPNDDLNRAMFVWHKSLCDSTSEMDDLVDFCEDEDINCILLSMYSWIGGGNWSSANVSLLAQLIGKLKDKGIKVWALAGNTDWGVNQKWVKENIIVPVQIYNQMQPEEAFSGFLYDVEYFNASPAYDYQDYIPAFCRLIESTKLELGVPVGCWITWWSMNEGQGEVEYDGLSATHGEHLMRAVDEAFIGSYSNIAESTSQQMGQIEMVKPFMDIADKEYRCRKRVWACSETKDIESGWATYHGKTKSQMEVEHEKISDEFNLEKGSSYAGIAVHHYDPYKDMS